MKTTTTEDYGVCTYEEAASNSRKEICIPLPKEKHYATGLTLIVFILDL